MTRALLAALALTACGSTLSPIPGDLYIEASTPIIAVGKWGNGKPVCAVAIEYDGRTVVFWGQRGCGVVHREVQIPTYHSDEAYRP